MQSNQSQQLQCQKHSKPLEYICLDQECSQNFLLCSLCNSSNIHKHSKTTIEKLSQVKQKLMEKWDNNEHTKKCQSYFKKVRDFYDQMRKQLINLVNEDQKIAENLIQKISYHHLPIEANSQSYLQFKRQQYARLDKASMLKLIEEAENGELNKNLAQQNQLTNLLDLQLSKSHQKLTALKYILLSKKMQVQLLCPRLQEQSKICQNDEFSKVYGLFNSKGLLIRSAKLIYRGSQTNFSSKKFFNSCNNQQNCLTLIRLKNGRKVGGFSMIPLVYHQQIEMEENQIKYVEDRSKRSFVFNLTKLASFDLKNTRKAIGYKNNAIGPIFGPDLNASSINVQSNLGISYQSPEGVQIDSLEAKVYLLAAGKIQMQQMEIWQIGF